MGYSNVNVHNSTSFPVVGSVQYLSCSPDNFNLAPNNVSNISRGSCLISAITAQVNVNGSWINASSYESTGTSYSQFAVVQTTPGVFQVTRLTNSIAGDPLLLNSGLKESADFYDVKDMKDAEATGLRILTEQQQQIEANWPKDYPKMSHFSSGKLLCSLRSKDSTVDERSEVSCVNGSLEEINNNAGFYLSKNDINGVTRDLLKAMVKARFKIKSGNSTYKCENGKTLYWIVSATSEPLENGKDAVIYNIGLAVE